MKKNILKNSYPSSFETKDNLKISFQTNFKIEDINPSRPLLIFNYGLVCSQYQWIYQVEFFDSKNEQILLYDYRNHFDSEGPKNIKENTYKNLVSDLDQLVSLFKTKNLVLFGHSMGVNICLEFTLLRPNLVKGLVLVSGSVFPPNDIMFDSNIFNLLMPIFEKMANKYPHFFTKLLKNAYKNPIINQMTISGGFNRENIDPNFVRTYLKKIGELNPFLFFQLYNEMQVHNIINSLEFIQTQTLIIGGDKDNIIPNFLQFILDKFLVNSEIYIVKGGSHVPQADFPEIVNERIEYFLKKLQRLKRPRPLLGRDS